MSYPQVLLISEDKVKSFTSINFNVSPEDLVPYMYDAQQIYCYNFLGGTYYQALQTRILNSTLTNDDAYLLDNFVGPMLCNYALMMALPFLKYRVYNKGVLSGKSENADSITLEELQWLQNQVRDVAQNYTQRMIEYLRQRPTQYPLYNAPNLQDGQLPDKTNGYSDQLTIPKSPYAYNQRMLTGSSHGMGAGSWYYGGLGIDCYNLPSSN